MNYLKNEERIEKAKSEVPVLDEYQKEALRTLDSQPMDRLKANAISELIGVVAGVKPAALIRRENGVSLDDIAAVGLHAEEMEYHYAVSRDEELGFNLRDTFVSKRNEDGSLTVEAHRLIGQMLGYPATATHYFLKRSASFNSEDRLPMVESRSLQNTPAAFFHQFILSPDNYKQEISSYIEPLEAAVKNLMPNTYTFIETSSENENEILQRKLRMPTKIGRFVGSLLFQKQRVYEQDYKMLYVD